MENKISTEAFDILRKTAREGLASPIGDHIWEIYDSTLEVGQQAYGSIFSRVVPERRNGEHRTVKEFIKEEYSSRKGELVMVDVGGPASKLAEELNRIEQGQKWLKRSLGVVLKDQRGKEQKKKDNKIGHQILQADAFSKKGFDFTRYNTEYRLLGSDGVKKWLANDKIDILFEKMHGVWLDVPFDQKFLYLVLNNWYKLMNENGIMFLQTPFFKQEEANKYHKLQEWADKINQDFSGRLKIILCLDGFNLRAQLSIRKLKNAPEDFPKVEL